jgi:hypothetical protein
LCYKEYKNEKKLKNKLDNRVENIVFWIKNESKWLFEKLFLMLVYIPYLIIDCFNNIILYFTKEYENRDILIDILVLFYFALGIYIYNNKLTLFNRVCFEHFTITFFKWRIITIVFIKLNEIFSWQFQGAKYFSFNRTLIFFLINFIEIVIGYSFLYTTSYFRVFTKRNLSTIIKTLDIFTNWNLPNDNLCLNQQILVLTQIIVFILIISSFIGIMVNFKFKGNKNKE